MKEYIVEVVPFYLSVENHKRKLQEALNNYAKEGWSLTSATYISFVDNSDEGMTFLYLERTASPTKITFEETSQ